GSEYFFKLVLPQKSIINKNTAQSVSDRLMNKHRRDRRVDTSAQPQYHFLVSELAFQHAYRRIDKYIRCPILHTTADSDHKIAKNRFTRRGMSNFRMKLDPVCLLRLHLVSGYFHRVRTRDYFKPLG